MENEEKQKIIQWLKKKKYKFQEFYYDFDYSGEHVEILKKEEIVVYVIIDNQPGKFYIENVRTFDRLVQVFESNNIIPSK